MEFNPAQPIWLQLVAEFSRRIGAGTWQPGQRISGVRELAAELGVNPNTVQRALAELERQHLCRTERAVGRFVTDDPARVAELRRDRATDLADAYTSAVAGLGLDVSSAIDLVKERWGHDSNRP